MIYPLYIMNWDQAENRDLITKSLDWWMKDTSAFRGYSWTGASSICAEIGRPDEAVKDLHFFVDAKGKYGAQPNTHYQEAGPVIETPLSAARSLQDILIQSWGGTIRVFPGVPESWKDVTIDKMRTEGAFLVSAVKRDGKTRWIRVQSLAGEPCRVKCDINHVRADVDGKVTRDGEVMKIDLKKGETITIFPVDSPTEMVIEPVAAQSGQTNTFGLP
jgi:hypothetical protein